MFSIRTILAAVAGFAILATAAPLINDARPGKVDYGPSLNKRWCQTYDNMCMWAKSQGCIMGTFTYDCADTEGCCMGEKPDDE